MEKVSHVADSAVERQNAPGQSVAVVASAVSGLDPQPAHAVLSRRHSGCRQTVGNERNAFPAFTAVKQLDRHGIDVDTVSDQLRCHACLRQHCSNHAGIPVPERPHGIEHVGGPADSEFHGLGGLLISRVRVAH